MNISKIVNETSCFDLQFRRDVRHKRTNSPIYYSWKAQFVIVGSVDKEELLRKIKETLDCGRLHYITGTQIRYSVQNIDELHDKIVPFFKEHSLSGDKDKDFELWSEAIAILYRNKGKALSQWPKELFERLITIQKSSQQYKSKKNRIPKWIPVAQAVLKHLTK
ncbi:MAG TPA: LAGLIDADG family homing endonuclease [Candidatus Paceibacterota bacterium]|nr:LAGLIDADG family homing endonuclease [Candidatus Paceibacterota bacterium]